MSDKPTVPPGSLPPEPIMKDLAEASVDQAQSIQALLEAFDDFTVKVFPGSIRGIHQGIAAGFKAIDVRIDEVHAKFDTFVEKYDRRLDRVERDIGALTADIGALTADIGKLDRRMGSLAQEIDRVKIGSSDEGRPPHTS